MTRRDALVVVRGGGDLGTGVAHRLVRSGYRVVVLECAEPRAVRRLVSFAEAVHSGVAEVEGVRARRVDLDPDSRTEEVDWDSLASSGSAGDVRPDVPVVVDPDGGIIRLLNPDVVIDARMAKRNLGISRDDAELTVALGPGFKAGADVDLVLETKRGHELGRVIERGTAIENTGVPGDVGGASAKRLIKAPACGEFHSSKAIGDEVAVGEEVGDVAGAPVRAAVAGLIRGLIADGLAVDEGDKLGDVDPRGSDVDPRAISDKARAIGGAALEALLSRGMLPR